MERLPVNLGKDSYYIYFEESFDNLSNVLEDLNIGKKLLIVTDSNVEKLYLTEVYDLLKSIGYDVGAYAFKAGEASKDMNTILDICKACMEHGMDRKSSIIALGGGVVGDMAGFAASIYMRGIDFVQVPTTLLSQSDSSVGGKTGVDFGGAKNILGAFHQPKAVYINVSTLKSLPKIEFISGMGEVIKHGIIRDRKFFDYLIENSEKIKKLENAVLMKMAYTNCSIKASVVESDEKELGVRADLNFGHTIGHAIEGYYQFKLTHGECVGLGMMAASCIAYKRGILEKSELDKIEKALTVYSFKTKVKIVNCQAVKELMNKDKKRVNGKINFILPSEIGKVKKYNDITEAETDEALKFISS
ncbi:MAG: 3-dehydroquinate synthase [Clostridia bacterium]|nr:3-dehydroquinate synthase [Clostridia bacterium]